MRETLIKIGHPILRDLRQEIVKEIFFSHYNTNGFRAVNSRNRNHSQKRIAQSPILENRTTVCETSQAIRQIVVSPLTPFASAAIERPKLKHDGSECQPIFYTEIPKFYSLLPSHLLCQPLPDVQREIIYEWVVINDRNVTTCKSQSGKRDARRAEKPLCTRRSITCEVATLNSM